MSKLSQYQQVFMDIFDVSPEELNENFLYSVRKWDSLTHLNLINALEDTFDVTFLTEDILHFGGYENGMRILEKYGVSFDS